MLGVQHQDNVTEWDIATSFWRHGLPVARHSKAAIPGALAQSVERGRQEFCSQSSQTNDLKIDTFHFLDRRLALLG